MNRIKLVLKICYKEELRNKLTWERSANTNKRIQAISNEIQAIIIRATWRGDDERLFIILNKEYIFLEKDDLSYLEFFPGFKLIDELTIELDIGIENCTINTEDTLLLPFSSRGNQSFAFGHMISEVIPDMVNLQNSEVYNTYKYLCFPLEEWSLQLIRFYNIARDFIFEANRVDFKALKPPIYSLILTKIAFYERDLLEAGSNFDRVFSKRLDFLSPCDKVEMITLSRKAKHRPMRWKNVDECIDEISKIDNIFINKVSDTSHTPKKMINIIRKSCLRTMYLCSPGSAAYTPLLLTKIPVIMAVPMRPSLNPQEWKNHLIDFSIYSSKLIVLFGLESKENESWDSLFEINKIDLTELIGFITGLKKGNGLQKRVQNGRIEAIRNKTGINMSLEMWNDLIK